MPEFIFTMKDLRKSVPPNREILKGIWLSFYFGAKIGVLGLNGAGKSSLLRIMAGEDTSFTGEAFPAKGIRVGFLPQEPQLDPAKTVLGNVEEALSAAAPVSGASGRIQVLNCCAGSSCSSRRRHASQRFCIFSLGLKRVEILPFRCCVIHR